MNYIANMVQPKSNPKIISSGPSSRDSADQLTRALGWFSIGLGLMEIFGANRMSHALGMPRAEGLIRAYGVREIGAGVMTLSTEKQAGLVSRVAGDALDIATLATAIRPDNPKRGNAALALGLVLGVTALDIIATQAVSRRNARRSPGRNYSDRSGFPARPRAAAPASNSASQI
ncbi:hypothetical protein M0654_13060 [Rhizobium sp. NTR19]|uniref:Cyclase dehydrase n=1 Tax=Neorhizobium turbinariae TaxID=2937795 RepID=A0ABT0ISR2_9HYPH|nr:hypothetical protein [Neorhizobium turbinariae]MCK8780915.1 hypothetical protein [Neorhizobium turbinariae]